MTIRDLEWVVGFLEGEGNFCANDGVLQITATQADSIEPIRRLHRLFGGSVRHIIPKNPRWKEQDTWCLMGIAAAGLAMTLYLLLSSKRRRQIRTALAIWKGRPAHAKFRHFCPRGHPRDSANTILYVRKNRKSGKMRACKICVRSRAWKRVVETVAVGLFVCLFTSSSYAQPEAQGNRYIPQRVFFAWPERVVDGLTVIFPQGICRLAGLDAPFAWPREPGEPERDVHARADRAEHSRRALEELLGHAPALVADFGPDRQGRMVCILLTATGQNANLEMVGSGWAEAYLLPGTPFAAALREAEEHAWQQKKGLWGFPHYRRARDERKRLRGGPGASERSAPNYWDTVPDPSRLRAPPCLDPSCR